MKRHPILVPLSHEHHHTLALCARILRNPELNHSADINEHYVGLMPHFEHEETMFAPHWQNIPVAMRERFEAEHAKLRSMMANPEYLNEAWNKDFAVTLRDHARFEERELFPAVEPFLPEPEGI